VLDAFRSADQVLLSGVQGITDLITTPGLINLDFADVKSVMSDAGSALMGIGSARGEDRAKAAAIMAISSPLLEASIDGARGVLLSISGGSDLGLFEINESAQLVAEAAHPEANIIFGAVIDDALGDEVRVTVIAAGFDGGQPPTIVREPVVRSGQNQSAQQERPSEFNRSEPGRTDPHRTDTHRSDFNRADFSRSEFNRSGSTAAGRSMHTIGSVPRAEDPAPRHPEPPAAPHVPQTRPPYVDTPAEELDVPDFLK